MAGKSERIAIENVLQPGKTYPVDAAKFNAMREAVLAVLPDAAPGVTVPKLKEAVLPRLPESLFPGGDKAGWWIKAVQLDLEAKGVVARAPSAPVRLHRT
ncbi:DUF6958 family protein [Sphingomonas sp. M1-B02]|uniref:DUF6958 family protein n=1 Tax=Sphingomonas sp. M1-B02 TaxID=3114300 RepID=UPI00223F512E|nr:hypothetical protein [Sphingomonas sp. S6-11]UZK64734.1 hypothetical protein OKW87_09310 [Sphingomonas sp. S6-11]